VIGVIDELLQLLRRQTEAATALQARVRALELVVAADESRFVATALDEVEDASQRLAALEMTRSLTLVAAGLGADVPAIDLAVAIGAPDHADTLRVVVAELREAVVGAVEARDRATAVVGEATMQGRARLHAAEVLASV
jgi:hypothetical protein